MVEIFTSSAANTSNVTGQITDNLRLGAPSDVYFGASVPGIAFYEKSGKDLSVTLLDGQLVTIGDFFVIGESGEFSRLLLGPGGNAELTGLVAPEPFEPPSEEPTQVAAVEAPPAEAHTPVALQEPVQAVTESSIEQTPVAEAGTADVATDAGAGFFGLAPDQLLFAAISSVPILIALGSSSSDSKAEEPETAGMDTETAVLVEGIFDGDDAQTVSSDGAILGATHGTVELFSADTQSSLLDDLSQAVDPV